MTDQWWSRLLWNLPDNYGRDIEANNMGFIDIRHHGRLLFRYDPDRHLVEIKPPHGEIELVDLSVFERPAIAPEETTLLNFEAGTQTEVISLAQNVL